MSVLNRDVGDLYKVWINIVKKFIINKLFSFYFNIFYLWKTSCQRAFRYYWLTTRRFFLDRFNDLLHVDNFRFFGCLQTSLLCIVGELVGGRFVAVAVGVSDSWQVTGDRWLVIVDMVHDIWHMSHDTWHFFFFFFSSKIYCQFLSVSVRSGIGATIRTYQEIQCLPYAE